MKDLDQELDSLIRDTYDELLSACAANLSPIPNEVQAVISQELSGAAAKAAAGGSGATVDLKALFPALTLLGLMAARRHYKGK